MDRNQEILERRLEGRTYQAIADEFNISRQRVQQLLSPPKGIRDLIINKADKKCEACGVLVGRSGHIHHENGEGEDYNDIPNLHLLCPSCHSKRHMHSEEARQRISQSILAARKRILKETGYLPEDNPARKQRK